MIEDRLKEIAEQKKEIRKVIENEDLDIPELEDLDKRLDELLSEEEELRKKLDTADKIMKGTAEYKEVPKPGEVKKVANIYDTEEYRTAFLSRLMGKPAEKRTGTTPPPSLPQSLYFDSKEATGAGAVIPTQTANVLFDKMVSIAPMLNEINLLRVAGNLKFAIPPERGIVGVHTELEQVAMTAGAWTEVTLGGYEYVSVFRISKTVATMSINAFEGWLTDMLAADLAVAIENAIINGDGDGKPKGLASIPWGTTAGSQVVDFSGTAGSGTAGSGTAGELLFDDVMDALGKLPQRYHSNAKWLMNNKTFYTQVAKVRDNNNTPIYVADMQAGSGFRIMGLPVILSDLMADDKIYLGDFTKIVGNLPQDITVEASTQSGFLANAIDFRGACMFDCAVALSDAFVLLKKAS